MNKKKYLTIAEAEALIPRLHDALQTLRELQKTLTLLEEVEVDVEAQSYDSVRTITKVNKEFHFLSYKFYEQLYELERQGIVVTELEEGVIDFFSRFEGRDIFLCWKEGEQSIIHWHELEETFENRKKILDLAQF